MRCGVILILIAMILLVPTSPAGAQITDLENGPLAPSLPGDGDASAQSQVPDQPRNLKGSPDQETGGFRLSWDPVVGAQQYIVSRNGVEQAILDASTTTHLDVAPAHLSIYEVAAANLAGRGESTTGILVTGSGEDFTLDVNQYKVMPPKLMLELVKDFISIINPPTLPPYCMWLFFVPSDEFPGFEPAIAPPCLIPPLPSPPSNTPKVMLKLDLLGVA